GRPVVLAGWAREAGYDVSVACGKANASIVQAAGLPWEELPALEPATFHERVARGDFFYTSEELDVYVEAETRLLDRVRPDLIVSDLRLSMAVSAARLGIPVLSLLN